MDNRDFWTEDTHVLGVRLVLIDPDISDGASNAAQQAGLGPNATPEAREVYVQVCAVAVVYG